MAQDTLLIDASDVRKYTPVKGALDDDYLNPAILVTQDLELSYVLGYNLTEKLKDLKALGTLETTSPYDDLFKKYVRPYLRYASMVVALDGIRVDLNNQGVIEKNSQQGSSVSNSDYGVIKVGFINKVDGYKKLLHNHLCRYSYLYPEYTSDQEGAQNATDDAMPYGIDSY